MKHKLKVANYKSKLNQMLVDLEPMIDFTKDKEYNEYIGHDYLKDAYRNIKEVIEFFEEYIKEQ